MTDKRKSTYIETYIYKKLITFSYLSKTATLWILDGYWNKT